MSSITVLPKIHVGLANELAVPKDSYMMSYLQQISNYVAVGPPVFFVVKDGYNYSDITAQKKLCAALSFCDDDSILMELGKMAKAKNRTYIAFQPIGWLDVFFEFAQSPFCCFTYKRNDSFCPSLIGTSQTDVCKSCKAENIFSIESEEFYRKTEFFLEDVPWEKCSKGGKSMFKPSVEIIHDLNNKTRIGATNFMTYHTVLKTSEDFYEALKWSREISKNLTRRLATFDPNAEVFPYSVVHVYFEQYLTIWLQTGKMLGLCSIAVFISSFVFLSFDFISALLVVFTIIIITVNLMGLMYWWNVSLNALSLVNLIVSVGIAVEFCVHITRAYIKSLKPTRKLKVADALYEMGISVLSGITFTDCGILFLAFAKSQVLQVYYFRMYVGIIVFGTVHSLVLLPVLLSLFGQCSKVKAAIDIEEYNELIITHV